MKALVKKLVKTVCVLVFPKASLIFAPSNDGGKGNLKRVPYLSPRWVCSHTTPCAEYGCQRRLGSLITWKAVGDGLLLDKAIWTRGMKGHSDLLHMWREHMKRKGRCQGGKEKAAVHETSPWCTAWNQSAALTARTTGCWGQLAETVHTNVHGLILSCSRFVF